MIRILFYVLAISAQLISVNANAQESPSKITATLCDGFIIAGYVHDGGFINFGGPALKLTHKPFNFILGMLPSLKFKEDRTGATKNSFITPTLGAGLTIAYKHIALQAPLYYNTKTASGNGRWHAGIGLGYKF